MRCIGELTIADKDKDRDKSESRVVKGKDFSDKSFIIRK